MKIYNQGGRLFTHYELDIKPGVFTDVPEKYEDGISKLLADYPTELITSDEHSSARKAAAKNLVAQASRIKELEGEIENLKARLSSGDVTEAQQKAMVESKANLDRADAAEASLAKAEKQIAQLEEKLTAPKK